ncbi:MAG: hypothetical protein BWK76_06010 [Desulfobulbaceae bacterium A2]|nr:MAG: hypothetical protein BWK76_06010 [Desulfobulbaceae bacterium A2]
MTNRLADESSPYLLQHAGNPVAWQPWDERALAQARGEHRLIFLSVGYSTCHWCHVMAHESFEDAEVAALLNRDFVCIKVDREERPDIDRCYMAAAQALSGSGGWPLTVFLTPEGLPFHAGTYFPKRSGMGRPGMLDLVPAVAKAWQERPDELRDLGRRLIEALREEQQRPSVAASGGDDDLVRRATAELQAGYDAQYGGFGQAPKFPRPASLLFLLDQANGVGHAVTTDMALHTLRCMAAGGIHDRLGGGFHRYSVDQRWLVPHFEKMLYDQALLTECYLQAFLRSNDDALAAVARGICDYLLRDLAHPEGGFCSGEDADTPDPERPEAHGEGLFYLWRQQEIVRLLGARRAEIFCDVHGVSFDGNLPGEEWRGRNILLRTIDDAAATERWGLAVQELSRQLSEDAFALLAVRQQRPRPHRDDKVILAWNGLAVAALALAGRVLDEPRYLAAAREAAQTLPLRLADPESGRLARVWCRGRATALAQLDDYAYFVHGLLALHQADGDPVWLAQAIELVRQQQALFARPGGGWYDGPEEPDLPLRTCEAHDGAEPAGNSVAITNLLHLARLTGDERWHRQADEALAAWRPRLRDYPSAMPWLLRARVESWRP